MIGGGEPVSLIDAPGLAEINRRINMLPPWRLELPLPVEPELYQQASTEWDQIMRDRGWWVQAADIGRANFLFRGVAIVQGEREER